MNKPNGYDQAKPRGGVRNEPQRGGYILGIINAETKMSTNNNEMLVLKMDIAEGEFQGHFREISDAVQKDLLLKHYRVTDSEKSIPYFKGDIKAIEESNQGFVFNFDEKTLRGKKVGAVLINEEYVARDGDVKTCLKIAYICNAQKIRDGSFTIPKDKILSDGTVQRPQPATSDDDLPF